MTNEDIIKRLELLQQQAQQLIEQERRQRNEAKIERALRTIRDYYIGRMCRTWDPALSARIDALNWLIGE